MNIESIPNLSDCIDFNNPYATKYIDLISTPDEGTDLEGHHIVPAAFYKYVLGCEKTRLVSSLDMVPENIVQLTKVNHVLAHYYLARCIKNPNNIFTDSQLYAFVNMFSKRLMKKHPLFEEMAAFAEENKKVKSRYKQYDLCPPTIPIGCSFYKDAITNNDRTGAWITQIRDHGNEHYTYDHFGNCLNIQIEGHPSIWVVRSLTDGRVLSIATDADDQITYAGFSENGSCHLCYNWLGETDPKFPYRANQRTYRFADAMHWMSNYISHILTDREFASFISVIEPYVGKRANGHGKEEPYQYYDIPAAPRRMYSQAHCDKMVKQYESTAETWMNMYNDGTRSDGLDVANYYKKLSQMWRDMDATTLTKKPGINKAEHPITNNPPVHKVVACEPMPAATAARIVQYRPELPKLGFWRRLLAFFGN